MGFNICTISGAISIVCKDWGTGLPLIGDYGLVVTPVFKQHSLVQRGEIPADAPFWMLQAIGWQSLFIDGEVQPILERSSNHLMFDLSEYAGQEVELRLTALHPGQEHFIDNLQFVVPEPSTKALFALGGGMAALALWRSRKRKEI